MIIEKTDRGVVLRGQECFDPEQTFCCGQCFRFDRVPDGWCGVAGGRVLHITPCADGWLFEGISETEFSDFWADYFDLEKDYATIAAGFPEDAHLQTAVHACSGIRLLRQDPWETTASFILSSNNNIPRIKKIIGSLCENFGEPISGGFFSFPTPEKLAGLTVDGLAVIRSGFRAKYLLDAAVKFASGDITPEAVRKMNYADAKRELMRIKGVGNKVADCALLFGFGFYSAFPIDTWIRKVLDTRYGEGFDPTFFGEWAGLAQQYLFYYERGTRE